MEDLKFKRFNTNPTYDEIDYTREQLLSRDKVIPSFTEHTSVNNIGILTTDVRTATNVNDVIITTSSSIFSDIKIYNIMKDYYGHCERCGCSLCLETMKDDNMTPRYTLCDECFRLLNNRNSIIGDKDTYTFDTVLDVI